jgi:hypothetical protein
MAKSEARYWEDEARDISRTSLEQIRATATAWVGTTAVLLGVFGTVAIISGPDALKGLSKSVQGTVLVLTAIAAAFAGIGILASALAWRGIPKKYSPLTGLRLAKYTKDRSRAAAVQLKIGRAASICAAALVVIAGLVAMWSTLTAPERTFAIVRTTSGEVECGRLTRDAAGNLHLTNRGKDLIPLTASVESVQVVDSCP